MAEPLTRDIVVHAMRDLIRDHGVDQVSLRDVASHLGVTAPALYGHVRDRHDLLAGVADLEFTALMEQFGRVDHPDPMERTRRYSRAYVDHAIANPTLFPVMFLFQPRLAAVGPGEVTAPEPPATQLASADAAFGLAAASMTEAIEAGQIRDVNPLVAILTTWVTAHGLAQVLLMGFGFDDAFRDELIDSVIDTTLRGLRAT